MAIFVRPAVWSYDLALFRQAIADDRQLEALMGAVALEEETLLVAECNEVPSAFAWTRTVEGIRRTEQLYVTPGPEERTRRLAAALAQRLKEESISAAPD